MSKLVVTGASGHLGRLTLDALLASGKVAAADIVAVSRDPSKLADYAAKGVDTRMGDFAKPETLATAFAGADRVAIISVDSFPRGPLHMTAIEAAKAAGAKHIVYTSLAMAEGVPVTFGADHFETEDAIKATGIPYTFLRNSWYAENLFMALPSAIKGGTLFSASAKGRTAYAPRESFAAALAAALAADTNDSKTYTLTGTKTYAIDDVVALANDVLGTSVAVAHLTDDQLVEGMKQAGVPEPVVPVLVSMDTNIRNGGLDIVTNDVKTLTGADPMSLEDFLKANKDALLAAAK